MTPSNFSYSLQERNGGWCLEVYRHTPDGDELCGMSDTIPYHPRDIDFGSGPVPFTKGWDGHELGIVLGGLIAIGRHLALKGYPPFGATSLRVLPGAERR